MKHLLLLACCTVFLANQLIAQIFVRDTTIALPAGASTILWGDYDNDHFYDIFNAGSKDEYQNMVTHLYRNDRNDGFTFTEMRFPNVGYCGADWGDFDNDGDIDLLYSGETNNLGLITKIYRNDGNGALTDIHTRLRGSNAGYATWIDHNNDGLLDIHLYPFNSIYEHHANPDTFIFGPEYFPGGARFADFGDLDKDGIIDVACEGYESSTRDHLLRIYKKNNSTYSLTWEGTSDASGVSAEWCDLNADGYQDVIFSLSTPGVSGYQRYTYFLANNHDGTFSQVGQKLYGNNRFTTGDVNNDGYTDIIKFAEDSCHIYLNARYFNFVKESFLMPPDHFCYNGALADYDNDGDLDLALVANHIVDDSGPVKDRVTFVWIYKNTTKNPNQPPGIPAGLTTHVNGDTAILSWQISNDDLTPDETIGYNVYIGSAGKEQNILSSGADISTGFNLAPNQGKHNTPLKIIQGLAPGYYHWAVQAIDNGYASSPFSELQYFNIGYPRIAILQPYDQEALPFNKVNLKWFIQDTMDTFQVQLSDSENFQNILTDSTLSSFLMQPDSLLPDMVYYWRVRPLADSVNQWSDTLSFHTLAAAPSLLTPKQGMTLQDKVITFSWVDYHNKYQYRLQIADNIDFYNPYQLNDISSTIYNWQRGPQPDTLFWRIQAYKDTITSEWSTANLLHLDFITSILSDNELPTSFQLEQNYPNPFNAGTRISYDLPQPTHVTLSIFNLKGQKVATPCDQFQSAGEHSVIWQPGELASGVYIFSLKAGNFTEFRKCLYLK